MSTRTRPVRKSYYDTASYHRENQRRKDERTLSDFGSKKRGYTGVGSTIGSLLGTYGLPALLAVMPGGQPLAGAALLAASAGGASLGSGLGGLLGGLFAGDMPDTKFFGRDRLDLTSELNKELLSDAIISGVTTTGSGLAKGIEAGGKLQKDVYKPLDWLMSKKDMSSLYDFDKLLTKKMTAANLKDKTYEGFEQFIKEGDTFIDKLGIEGNKSLISGLNELYRPGAYIGFDPAKMFKDPVTGLKSPLFPWRHETSQGNMMVEMNKMLMDPRSGEAGSPYYIGGTPGRGNYIDYRPYATKVDAQGQKLFDINAYLGYYGDGEARKALSQAYGTDPSVTGFGWHNLPEDSEMEAMMKKMFGSQTSTSLLAQFLKNII